MTDLISKSALKEKMHYDDFDVAVVDLDAIDSLPTIDAVPVGAYEQTRWERDMAISQLEEIGKSLCEKMDNVATVVRCKDCKYYREGRVLSPQKFCFRLRGRDGKAIGYNFADDDFCSYGERSEE